MPQSLDTILAAHAHAHAVAVEEVCSIILSGSTVLTTVVPTILYTIFAV